ncbi:MAG: hypothetical protein JXR84_00945, partial [Anaerolineae bacterium]|nr:hypothetical protein [Anaerolineae bacterium]
MRKYKITITFLGLLSALSIAALPGCRRDVSIEAVGDPSTRPTATPKPAAMTATAKASSSSTPTVVI